LSFQPARKQVAACFLHTIIVPLISNVKQIWWVNIVLLAAVGPEQASWRSSLVPDGASTPAPP
jgi:hypothetical protein